MVFWLNENSRLLGLLQPATYWPSGYYGVISQEVWGFDWVYLIVSPQSPFKGAENVMTGRERYEAAVEACEKASGDTCVGR
jgi:hypothetical protein